MNVIDQGDGEDMFMPLVEKSGNPENLVKEYFSPISVNIEIFLS